MKLPLKASASTAPSPSDATSAVSSKTDEIIQFRRDQMKSFEHLIGKVVERENDVEGKVKSWLNEATSWMEKIKNAAGT